MTKQCKAGLHNKTVDNTGHYETKRRYWSVKRNCEVVYTNNVEVCLDCLYEKRYGKPHKAAQPALTYVDLQRMKTPWIPKQAMKRNKR